MQWQLTLNKHEMFYPAKIAVHSVLVHDMLWVAPTVRAMVGRSRSAPHGILLDILGISKLGSAVATQAWMNWIYVSIFFLNIYICTATSLQFPVPVSEYFYVCEYIHLESNAPFFLFLSLSLSLSVSLSLSLFHMQVWPKYIHIMCLWK